VCRCRLDAHFVVTKTARLLRTLTDLEEVKALPGFASCALASIEVTQMLVQAVWQRDLHDRTELSQLPHLAADPRLLQFCLEKKKEKDRIKSVRRLLEKPEDERRCATHGPLPTHAHTHTHTHTYAFTHMHAYIHTHTFTRTPHARMHTQTHPYCVGHIRHGGPLMLCLAVSCLSMPLSVCLRPNVCVCVRRSTLRLLSDEHYKELMEAAAKFPVLELVKAKCYGPWRGSHAHLSLSLDSVAVAVCVYEGAVCVSVCVHICLVGQAYARCFGTYLADSFSLSHTHSLSRARASSLWVARCTVTGEKEVHGGDVVTLHVKCLVRHGLAPAAADATDADDSSGDDLDKAEKLSEDDARLKKKRMEDSLQRRTAYAPRFPEVRADRRPCPSTHTNTGCVHSRSRKGRAERGTAKAGAVLGVGDGQGGAVSHRPTRLPTLSRRDRRHRTGSWPCVCVCNGCAPEPAREREREMVCEWACAVAWPDSLCGLR
jgi:hypothetical protein